MPGWHIKGTWKRRCSEAQTQLVERNATVSELRQMQRVDSGHSQLIQAYLEESPSTGELCRAFYWHAWINFYLAHFSLYHSREKAREYENYTSAERKCKGPVDQLTPSCLHRPCLLRRTTNHSAPTPIKESQTSSLSKACILYIVKRELVTLHQTMRSFSPTSHRGVLKSWEEDTTHHRTIIKVYYVLYWLLWFAFEMETVPKISPSCRQL